MAESVKIGRTVRLTPDVNERLLKLCGHLGVNPNAYMVSEIGKAVARDEVSYRATSRSDAMFDGIAEMMLKAGQQGD